MVGRYDRGNLFIMETGSCSDYFLLVHRHLKVQSSFLGPDVEIAALRVPHS